MAKLVQRPQRQPEPEPDPDPEGTISKPVPNPRTRHLPAEEQRTSVNARLRQGSSLGRLFAAVDGDGDGDLDRDEVKELLRKEGLDSSDAHVDGIFDRYFVGCPVISV